jgi:asparaginyl-tRNA synthetase
MFFLCPSLSTGASVDITGTLIQSAGDKQTVELKASTVKLIGECPVDSYPLQKKRHRSLPPPLLLFVL